MKESEVVAIIVSLIVSLKQLSQSSFVGNKHFTVVLEYVSGSNGVFYTHTNVNLFLT